MLYENDVVDATIAWLEHQGWTIESFAHANQTGDDIRARQGGDLLLVEAKGATSSVGSSAKYGEPFSKNQVNDHVAKAVLRAMQYRSNGVLAAIALPDNQDHRAEIAKAQAALREIRIGVFWVAEDNSVRLEHPEALKPTRNPEHNADYGEPQRGRTP